MGPTVFFMQVAVFRLCARDVSRQMMGVFDVAEVLRTGKLAIGVAEHAV